MLQYNLDITPNSVIHNYTIDKSTNHTLSLYESGYFEAGKSYYTKRDNKECLLLIYTVSGCGMLNYRNQNFFLTSNSAIIIDCRELHLYETKSDDNWCFYWIHFDGIGVLPYNSYLITDAKPVMFTDATVLLQYFNDIEYLSSNDDIITIAQRNIDIEHLLLETLKQSFIKDNSLDIIKENDFRLVNNYIHKHLSDKLTLDELVEIVHMSKYHFIRVFKNHFGVTPYRYIQICRIKHAKNLLLSSSFSISEISSQCGFPDPVGFTRTFKGFVGMTPIDFRHGNFRWDNR